MLLDIQKIREVLAFLLREFTYDPPSIDLRGVWLSPI